MLLVCSLSKGNYCTFHHVLSVPSVPYAFLKLFTVFDLFITPGTMFQASLEPPLSSFFNFRSFYLKNSVLFREEESIVNKSDLCKSGYPL
jgi:hypothetical protein